MSHELRTPLNVILGYAEMLADASTATGPAATSLHARARIQRQRDRAARAGQRDARPGPHSRPDATSCDRARSTSTGCSRELAAELEAARARRRTPASAGATRSAAVPVLTDRVKLKTILKNLVGNAIKFTRARHGRGHRRGSPATQLVLAVRDTGIGIAAERPAGDLRDVPPGRRLVARSTFGGVGLGLYIVQQLVERLHGSVAVESTVGVGSTFTVRIPTRVAPIVEVEGRKLAAG